MRKTSLNNNGYTTFPLEQKNPASPILPRAHTFLYKTVNQKTKSEDYVKRLKPDDYVTYCDACH